MDSTTAIYAASPQSASNAQSRAVRRNAGKQNPMRLDPAALAARVQWCFETFQAREGRHVTLEEYGTIVARAEGRGAPYGASSVRAWFLEKGSSPPSPQAVLVMARLVGADPGWVIYGSQTRAPAPETWGSHFIRLPRRTRSAER